MTIQTDVTIFGGSGFLGRRITASLLDRGLNVRVAVRHPRRVEMPSDGTGRLEAVEADITHGPTTEAAIRGSRTVVNAVSLYVEGNGATFRSVHVDGAGRLAATAREYGVERFLHISGVGAHPAAPSRYERCRGEGEEAVRRAFPDATIFRPSVIFGPGDSFLTNLTQALRFLPVFPLFGAGRTRLQPVFVGDVAEAAANVLTGHLPAEHTFELGGPKVYTFRTLLNRIMDATARRRALVSFPFSGWDALAAAASVLPSPPLTRSQVALMKRDNVASADLPGLKELGVQPTDLEVVLRTHFAN